MTVSGGALAFHATAPSPATRVMPDLMRKLRSDARRSHVRKLIAKQGWTEDIEAEALVRIYADELCEKGCENH